MSHKNQPNIIHTQIWEEVPEADNPFAARAAFCRGYDVYGEMLGRARFVDMLYLLFRGEAPTDSAANTLEALAVALANPGPRDASVHAAMCAGVCGSVAASGLMAALAVGAGGLSGGREVFRAMENWKVCGQDMNAWRIRLTDLREPRGSVWPAPEHAPGFDPHGVTTSTIVRQTLTCLAAISPGSALPWLERNFAEMESFAGAPLAMSGVAAAAMADLGFTSEEGEMLYLLLRLPGAAAHALEQSRLGYKKFPFGEIDLVEQKAEAV